MAGLSSDDRSIIEKKFQSLEGPVTVLLHKPEGKEEMFDDFMAALEEICAMSDLLSLKDMVEMETNEEIVHDVDMFPALVLLDKDGVDHGIRFYGVPTNRTFSVFIDTIVLFSNGKMDIEEEDQEKIKVLDENRLQILCTPSVPDLEKYLSMTFGLCTSTRRLNVLSSILFNSRIWQRNTGFWTCPRPFPMMIFNTPVSMTLPKPLRSFQRGSETQRVELRTLHILR